MRIDGKAISFRADASVRLGAGHVMRCLTLADELRRQGAACRFICTEQPGDLIREIAAKGYPVHSLMPPSADTAGDSPVQEIRDGEATSAILSEYPSAMTVVDHYSLGEAWESLVRSNGRRVVAIDDLADRRHDCDLLIDQNLGRSEDDYRELVPSQCKILVGTRFALLRSEFAEWRDYSLRRREGVQIRRLFISIGGFDSLNITGKLLAALHYDSLPADCRITIALRQGAPWKGQIQDQASRLLWATDVLVDTPCIAEIMAECDLAVGAAGGSAWERCCLGLPTLIMAVAENQIFGARALARANAAYDLGHPRSISESLPGALKTLSDGNLLAEMGLTASRLVDGLGVGRVCRHMAELLGVS